MTLLSSYDYLQCTSSLERNDGKNVSLEIMNVFEEKNNSTGICFFWQFLGQFC